MPWTTKTKIEQDGDIEYILTPDLHRILVGESEDQELIYQEAYSNWSLRTKEATGSWGLKSKISA